MKLKNNVIIAIPIYRRLKENEIFALDNNLQVLNQYDVTFIKPKGLDTQELNKRYPQVKEIEVSDNWLGTKKGIEGYNEMMLSPDFYDLFLEYEYLLICQTDVWVFRDDLTKWCNMGIDLGGH